MRKYSITRKALRVYAAYNPKYFPLLFLQTVFNNLAPYFNLWMSAEIVTALYELRGEEEIYRLVLITLIGNLLIHVIGAALTKSVATQLEILNNNEAVAFNQKTLSMDYDKLENPDIRQHRRNITENAYINYYGVTYADGCRLYSAGSDKHCVCTGSFCRDGELNCYDWIWPGKYFAVGTSGSISDHEYTVPVPSFQEGGRGLE